ncbi:MAG: tetratricopeptide repeat protein [Candidatus Wildermuthbacteria bacterium]|nr:tetratricopeptide repeat protein [Candidatus Wildermuthbacteria bacterium]
MPSRTTRRAESVARDTAVIGAPIQAPFKPEQGAEEKTPSHSARGIGEKKETAWAQASWPERIAKASVCLLAALLPLWFLPFTQDVLAYQKQILLLAFVVLASIAWLADSIGKQEIVSRRHAVLGSLALLVGAVGISSALSLWSYGSFWGFPLNSTDSFATLFGFAMLYVLIVHVYREPKELALPYLLLAGSLFLGTAFALLQLLQLYILPFAFARASVFNTLGSVNNIALLAAAFLPMVLALMSAARSFMRWALFGIILFFAAFLVLVNFASAWIVLLAGLSALIVFGMWNSQKRVDFSRVSFPIVLLALALFFLMFRVAIPWSPNIPLEVSPSFSSEVEIAKSVLQERPVTGSGPGTFVFDYAKHHSAALNQTVFWSTRFASGSSELFDWVVTKGALGALSLLLFIAFTLRLGLKNLLSLPEDQASRAVSLGSSAMFAALSLSLALYPASFITWFLFWASAAGVFAAYEGPARVFSIAPPSRIALAISSAFLFVLIFGIGFFYVQGQKYTADIRYTQGLWALQTGNNETAIARMFSAVNLNPSIDIYWRDLAQVYLAQIGPSFSNEAFSKEQRQQQAQSVMANAIAAAKRATALSPNNVANWNVLGFVYRNLVGIPQAEEFAISSYEKAAELEPASPFAWAEMGRVYAASGQNLSLKGETKSQSEAAYAKALDALANATGLKSDYAPAHFLIATVYEGQGRTGEASRKLKEIANMNPSDTGIAFQLGVLYWQKKDIESAQKESERAKTLNPLYANARYMLGLVYEKQGRISAAKEEFEAVLRLNPKNEEIKNILANLEAGKPALEGIAPSQPPVSENPPEIKTQEPEPAQKKEK